jgi:electron transport complex protein RnfC
MKNSNTFPKGGIHPRGNKQLSAHSTIRNAVIPSTSIIPLQQHIGSPPECLVQVGDQVKEGMLLAKSTGFISSNIHSPVPGEVTEIRDVFLANGFRSPAVVVELAGEFDALGKKQAKREWTGMNGKELLDLIRENGIVGLGGATFPSAVKLTIPKQKKVEAFVINGVECEPYLTADYRLMLEKTEEILEGIRIVHKILKPDMVFFAIELNKPDAIEVMTKALSGLEFPAQVVPLKVKYPQGDEKQVLKAVLDREVPSGGLPMDIGAVVSNVGTIYAIYEAIVLQKPLIERVVTVSGKGVKKPANLKARIGTPIGSLIEECGGFTTVPEKIIVGGPMMGFTAADLDIPVTKGTSGILALTKREIRDGTTTHCLECGRCIGVCPMGLSPTLLYKLIDHGLYEEAMEEGLMDCKECGCCGFSCPAHIHLIQSMKLGKFMAKKRKKQ